MLKALLNIFKWSKLLKGDFVAYINSVTNWLVANIAKLFAANKSLAAPKLYSNEIQLLDLQKTLQVKNKIGVEVDVLYSWSDVRSFF